MLCLLCLDGASLRVDDQVEWTSTSTRPRIVVLGTGWGSVSFLKGLDSRNTRRRTPGGIKRQRSLEQERMSEPQTWD